MYIQKLESWTDKDWHEMFNSVNVSYGLLDKFTVDLRRKFIKDILTKNNKEEIESYFPYLFSIGFINGMGPSYFSRSIRRFISFLFPYVRWEWHDIFYTLGGNEDDRNMADEGLLKYTLKSVRAPIYNAVHGSYGPLERLVYMAVGIIFIIPHLIIGLSAYGLVRLFGSKSFRYITK